MAEPVTAPGRLDVGPSPAPRVRRRRQVRLAPLVAIAVAALPTLLWTILMWGHGEEDVPTGAPPSNVATSAAPASVFTPTPLTATPVTAAPATTPPLPPAPVPTQPAAVTPAALTPAAVSPTVTTVPVAPEPAPPTTTAAVVADETEAVAATASPAAPLSTVPEKEEPVVSSTTAPTRAASESTTPPTSAPSESTTPPTSASSIPPPLTATQADRFFRDYYAAVEAGDYETSWSQLAPEFQRGRARSFDYYVNFWDENDIEVGEIELVASDDREATVHVDLSWNDTHTWQTDEFLLRRHKTSWVIAGQTTVNA